jgi:SAM-dependent methyltransferase
MSSSIYDPDLYDVSTPVDVGGDLGWYRRKARDSDGPILELGAGTGRITIPLAEDGHAVHALDASTPMLDALKRKLASLPADVRERITTTAGDMRSFQLGQRFAMVIIPFRAFLHNLTTDDQLSCLRCVFDHLADNGRLTFNVFHPSLQYMAHHAGALTGTWRWVATYRLAGGGVVVRSEANRYDTIRRRVFSLHKYEQFGADGVLTRTFLHNLELAYLYPPDILRLLETAGFQSIRIFGGFDERPLQHDTDEMVIEAVRG